MSEDFLKALENYKPRKWNRIRRQFRSIISFPRNKYLELKYFYQRGKHGWSIPDAWDLDGYLARVMGESIAHLAETTHGWPGPESEWPEFKDWQNELREVSKKLIAYDQDRWTWQSFEESQQVYDEFSKALVRVSKYWGHLWD